MTIILTPKKIIISVTFTAMVGLVASTFTRWGLGVYGQHEGD